MSFDLYWFLTGINDLELWIISCIIFVFVALFIYGTILCLNCVAKGSKINQGFEEGGSHLCDKVALFAMPLSFAIYVLIYVTHYTKKHT